MEKDGGIFVKKLAKSMIEDEISELNHLIRILGRHIEKFEEAYKKKDSREFNILKRHIIEIQRRIHSIIR